MDMREVCEQIEAIRREWGQRLLILGHHYQRMSVLRHADFIGDSLELSRKAAESSAERIAFCGVRFMAESARILAAPQQDVYMPVTTAGCPMANMASPEAVDPAWKKLQEAGHDWLPVLYVNSSAEMKAWCGAHGGIVCTSSNAARIFEWVFVQNKRVFFLPDEHLGRNTAIQLGIPDDEVAVYDWRVEGGGVDPAALHRKRVVIWKGFCIVHVAFTAEQIRLTRERLPEAKIIVHPETPREVAELADAWGSTSQIIKYVESLPPGTTVVIGTELNLIDRLAAQHKGRLTIKALTPSVCANMAKTNEHNLAELLQKWPSECRIDVPQNVAEQARMALRRMLTV